MPIIEKSVEVDVPVDVAYDQWTQFEEFPQFMDGVKEVRQLDDSRLQWTAEIGGQEASWEARIVDQVPHERIAWQATEGKDTSGLVTFEPLADDRSRVTVRFDWEAEGLVESIGGLLGADDRRVDGDLDRFKELVESRGTPSGAWHGEIHEGDVSSRGV
jgi:uncharacterized membrane protein